MASVTLSGVTKRFGAATVLHGVDLDVPDGEFCVFVGPSGCGKSTLLRLICGLDEVSGGTVAIGGEVVNDVAPARRGVAMVFQSYALYPHMSVAQNMGYALRLAGAPKADIDRRVAKAAATLRLDGLLDRKPRALSGGQRQRVAIGRAIVREPRLFLFDEPLSNLDAALRVEMRAEIAALKARLGVTMIYVTHDQTEAMTLADRIVVMNAGRVEQVGAPLDLYRRPANRFVAGFIGSPRMNLIAATLDGARRPVLGGRPAPLVVDAAPGTVVEIGVRPEHLRAEDRGPIAGRATLVEHLGSDLFVHVSVDGAATAVIARQPADGAARPGQALAFGFDPGEAHVFGPDGLRLAAAPALEGVA